MQLTQALSRNAATRPNAIATVFGDRRRSFRQVRDRVARLAAGFNALGATGGDRIGMLALNSDWYIEYYQAVYWAGCAVNPVNIRWSATEIAYSLDDCDTKILIVDDQFAKLVPELLALSRCLTTVIHVGDADAPAGMVSLESLVAETAPIEDAKRAGSDLAGVFYTGGTTGFPKGVMLSHQNLYINTMTLVAEKVLDEHSHGLIATPMFHIAAGLMMNGFWCVGARQIILPAFSPDAVLATIEAEQVTTTLLVPTMVQMFMDHPALESTNLRSLKTLMYAASPISEALVRRMAGALPDTALIQGYGMTELSPIATMLASNLHTVEGMARGKLRSAGRPTFCVEIRIMNENRQELPRGEVGEITVSGPCVMMGYWNKPEATAEAITDGWMHTGDAGYMDDEGFVFLMDRVKDMIITGGENVYSAEVENAICQHPEVAACAVIGIPDDKWGEAVHAVIIARDGYAPELNSVQDVCRKLIAGYKVPRSLEYADALPVTGAGKVQKTKLREPHWIKNARSVG